MTPTAIIMTVLLVVALGVFGALMWPRFMLLLKLKPAGRTDQIGARIGGTIKYAFAQWRMPRDPVAGFAHIFIFFGFLAVAFATISHFVHAYTHAFVLPGMVGNVYALFKDLFEMLVLVGCTYALWRRLKPGLTRVGKSWEGSFVLVMIIVLMLTDFVITAGKMAATPDAILPWSPGGYIAYLIFGGLGAETLQTVGLANWWVHCVVLLVFLNFLPIGKHFHVITSIPNVFLRNLEPWGAGKKEADLIAAMENDDYDTIEKLGIGKTTDLTWKMLLDTYSCTECGRCTMYCPTALTQKPLEHRELNKTLKKAVLADKKVIMGGDAEKIEELPDVVSEERVTEETMWACTTCGSCEQECPVLIENVPRIIEMRKKAVMMEMISPELQRAFRGMEQNSNPWGLGSDQRADWAEGLDVPRMADKAGEDEAPLLYWVGCAGSYDDRGKKVTMAMVKLLKAAGIDFAILGEEEGCTGDSARRAGNEFLFQMMATMNVDILNNYKVKKIVTHCPHCMHTLKTEYPAFGGNYEVIHHTELIAQLLAEGKIKLNGNISGKLTLHDSCYLARYHDISKEPRQVLNALKGAELVELPRHGTRSVCCGAGGARFWMEEDIGERINVHRSKEIVEQSPDRAISACPFCLVMLRDGIADLGKDEEIKTQDIAEIVVEAMAES